VLADADANEAIIDGKLVGLDAEGKSQFGLYRQVCAHDLKGIVAKPLIGRYAGVAGKPSWLKETPATPRSEWFTKRP
jgi:ATP-dependent DNA ligase